jgi:long-chain acyl-CoA synthetase
MTAPAAALSPGFPAMPIAHAHTMLTAPGTPFELTEGEVNGATMRIYKNAPPHLGLLLMASKAHGDKPFLVFEEERVSFAAHLKAVEQLAGVLSVHYGIRKGDRVAIAMRNYPQWSVAFFAAVLVGAIAVPLNAWWTGEELTYGLSDSGARLAIVDPERRERIGANWGELPGLEAMIVARATEEEGDPRVRTLESFIGPATTWDGLDSIGFPPVSLAADDPVTIFYTSGTTGRPKGALGSHRGIISNMLNSLACQARAFLRKGEAPPQPDPSLPQRATLVSVPFFHATGCFAVLVPNLASGGRLVLFYKWDPGEALKMIERERINAIGGVPAIAWQVLEHPDRDKYDLSSIDVVSYGGAPSAPELVTTIKRRFPNAFPGNGWGMTETSATATLNIGDDYVNRPDSAGHPAPAVELKVVNPEGQTLPTGEIGELWTRGPNNALGYWNKPDATASTFVDGWVVTGDLARIDAEGFLYIVDRAKDMLIRGGENVYCVEVESCLYAHPAVMDAAVVGIPHKVLGEEVGAVVQVKPGREVTASELRSHVAERLAAFKVPVEVVIQAEPLPRNANGKILKRDLKGLFQSRG